MFTLDELCQNVAACRDGRISFDDFEDWFLDQSTGAYNDAKLRPAFFEVESAISKIRFEHADIARCFEELAKATNPFVSESKGTRVVSPLFWMEPYGEGNFQETSTSSVVRLAIGQQAERFGAPILAPVAAGVVIAVVAMIASWDVGIRPSNSTLNCGCQATAPSV